MNEKDVMMKLHSLYADLKNTGENKYTKEKWGIIKQINKIRWLTSQGSYAHCTFEIIENKFCIWQDFCMNIGSYINIYNRWHD